MQTNTTFYPDEEDHPTYRVLSDISCAVLDLQHGYAGDAYLHLSIRTDAALTNTFRYVEELKRAVDGLYGALEGIKAQRAREAHRNDT